MGWAGWPRGCCLNILIVGEDVQSVNVLTFILRQEGYDVNTVVDRAHIEQGWSDYYRLAYSGSGRHRKYAPAAD